MIGFVLIPKEVAAGWRGMSALTERLRGMFDMGVKSEDTFNHLTPAGFRLLREAHDALAALKPDGEAGPAAAEPVAWLYENFDEAGIVLERFLTEDQSRVARIPASAVNYRVTPLYAALTVSPPPSERDELDKAKKQIRLLVEGLEAETAARKAAEVAIFERDRRLREAREGADKREKTSLWWFLYILAACGRYGASSSNHPDEWVSAFCDDSEPTDTLNTALNLKLAGWSHDSRTDAGRIWITDAGRTWLAAALSTPEPLPVADKREGEDAQDATLTSEASR